MSSQNAEIRRKRKKQTAGRVTRAVHYSWTNQEDVVLLRCLLVMADDSKWKGNNDTFRLGNLSKFEKMLEKELGLF